MRDKSEGEGKVRIVVRIDTGRIGYVIKLLSEPRRFHEIVEELEKKYNLGYEAAKKSAERILGLLCEGKDGEPGWGLATKLPDGRYILKCYYEEAKVDMNFHTLQLIAPIKELLKEDFYSLLMNNKLFLDRYLLNHLEIEYRDIYDLYRYVERWNGRYQYIPLNLIDEIDEKIEEFRYQLESLVEYVSRGGVFKYRVCRICKP
jgi:hypothetical protein